MLIGNLSINGIIRFGLLIILGICSFGLNTYVIEVGLYPLPSYIYTILSIALFVLYVFLTPKQSVHFFSIPVVIFLFATSFFILHYLFIQGSALGFNSITAHINALVYFPIWYLLFQMDEALLHHAQKVMAWVVALTVPMLVFHVFSPFSFTPLELSNPGRASGFFINPNIAGLAVVTIMLSSISIIPNKWKSLFLVWAGIGVFVTFSRSSMLMFIIASIGLIITSQVNFRQFFLTFFLAIIIMIFISLNAYQYLIAIKGINVTNIIDRLLWFKDLGEGTDYSLVAREQLFWEGLRLSTENPLLGKGAGALSYWPQNVHNMYLLLFVEYGVFGLLLLPILGLFLLLQGLRYSFPPLILLSLVIIINGIFSHNVIDNYTTFITTALLYALAEKKRKIIE